MRAECDPRDRELSSGRPKPRTSRARIAVTRTWKDSTPSPYQDVTRATARDASPGSRIRDSRSLANERACSLDRDGGWPTRRVEAGASRVGRRAALVPRARDRRDAASSSANGARSRVWTAGHSERVAPADLKRRVDGFLVTRSIRSVSSISSRLRVGSDRVGLRIAKGSCTLLRRPIRFIPAPPPARAGSADTRSGRAAAQSADSVDPPALCALRGARHRSRVFAALSELAPGDWPRYAASTWASRCSPGALAAQCLVRPCRARLSRRSELEQARGRAVAARPTCDGRRQPRAFDDALAACHADLNTAAAVRARYVTSTASALERTRWARRGRRREKDRGDARSKRARSDMIARVGGANRGADAQR